MSALAALEERMNGGGGGNRNNNSRREDRNQGRNNGNSRWGNRNNNNTRTDQHQRQNNERGRGDRSNNRDQGRSYSILNKLKHQPQATNSRWDLQSGDNQHGKVAKTATKESLKNTWGQIRAARQAKMAANEEGNTQQQGNQQRQQPQTSQRESGLSAFAARTSTQQQSRRQNQNHNHGKDRQRQQQADNHNNDNTTTTTTTPPEPEGPPPYEPPETTLLKEFFSNKSSIFRDWETTRANGWTNKNVANFFDKKKAGHDKERVKGKKGHGTDMRRIGQLFNRFYDYAHDINAGTNYVERALQICQVTGSCDFLDFGFAPGGMSHLLLSKHKGMRGSGVTLDPNQGGNVWPEWMDRDPRFFSCVGDVVDMAKDEIDLPKQLGLPDSFSGFDFVIVGITIHQGHLLGFEGEGGIMGHANELKDRLHFAQLYFAFKHLKPGGMVLMRHHMSVRLVDYHFLALMLSLFNPDKLALTNVYKRQQQQEQQGEQQGEKVGKEKKVGTATATATKTTAAAPATSKSKPPITSRIPDGGRCEIRASWADQTDEDDEEETTNHFRMPARESGRPRVDQEHHSQDARSSANTTLINLTPTIVATKPMAEFAIRKTYWVMYQGFDRDSMEQRDCLNILLEMLRLEPNKNAYTLNEEMNEKNEKPYFMPNLCGRGEALCDTLEKHGERAIAVLESVWKMQVVALKGFMNGKKDRMCKFGARGCRQYQRGRCHMAHYPEEMVQECWQALSAIPKDSPYSSSY